MILVQVSTGRGHGEAEPAGEQEGDQMGRNYDAVMETSFQVGLSGKESFAVHETQDGVVVTTHQMLLVISIENLHIDVLHHLALDKEIHFLATYRDLYHSF